MLSLLLALNPSNIVLDPSSDSNYWARFMMQLIIILLFSKLMAFFLGFVKQPPVIGEIIAGILLGPSCLGQWDWWKIHVFQTNDISSLSVTCISLVASLGIVLFMFYMGLELNEELVKRFWKTSVPIALCCVIFPFGVGVATATWIYDVNNDYLVVPVDRTSFYLFTGASMSFTALPVLASLLSATGLISTPVGILTISTATSDDVLAWCVLALSTAFAKGDPAAGGITFLLAVVFCALMFFVCRPTLAYIHNYYLQRGDEMNTSFTMIMIIFLLFSAFFSEIIHIHSFFGAFIAGLAAPKAGKWHLIMGEKLQFLSQEVLLPLFFVSSGARTDIGSLNNGELGGITVALTVIASLAKFTPGCLVTKLATGRDWRFSVTVGILMNTRGLVELIALNIGYSLGILSKQIFTALVIMAIVTTCMSAPLVWLIYQRTYIPELEGQANERIPNLHEANEEDMAKAPGDVEVVFHHDRGDSFSQKGVSPYDIEMMAAQTPSANRGDGVLMNSGSARMRDHPMNVSGPSRMRDQAMNMTSPSRMRDHPMNVSGQSRMRDHPMNISGGSINRSGGRGLNRTGGRRDAEIVEPIVENMHSGRASPGSIYGLPSHLQGRTPHPADRESSY